MRAFISTLSDGVFPHAGDKIEVFKEVDVLEERGRLTEILGHRVRKKLVKVMEVSNRSLLDRTL